MAGNLSEAGHMLAKSGFYAIFPLKGALSFSVVAVPRVSNQEQTVTNGLSGLKSPTIHPFLQLATYTSCPRSNTASFLKYNVMTKLCCDKKAVVITKCNFTQHTINSG